MLDAIYVKNFLSLNWLRPENALCLLADAYYVRPHLIGEKMIDLGCGNGYFTFVMMGGEFTPDYDYYVSADTRSFYQNGDIYNAFSKINISSFIKKYPERKFFLGVDHKEALLSQASQIGLYKSVLCQDLNKSVKMPEKGFDTIFSNIIYWLDKPYDAIKELGGFLAEGGELVLTFPNPKIYEYCYSYTWKKRKMSRLWERLNRGRLEHIKWVKTIKEFEEELRSSHSGFSVKRAKTYQNATTLLAWDIGLRPLSVPLINMSQKLSAADRREIKESFIDAVFPYVMDLLENELSSNDEGGWNFIVLSKTGPGLKR